jgi:hypothetical protein
LAVTAGLFLPASGAWAQPQAWRAEWPAARLAGTARLTFWGFKVYDASLWVAPGFRHDDYASHAFALELAYLRDFSASDIARRSIEEMRRVDAFSEAQATQWQQALQRAFPDVKAGDRIAGLNRPGTGVQFVTNGQPTGEIRDPEFARLFFGIWLSPRTSEPQLRLALLGTTAP